MKNFLMGLVAYIISYGIFYFLYRKLGAKKLINHKISKRVGLFLIAFIFYMAGISVTDSFDITKEYHFLFIGLFIGPTIALLPFIVPINNNKIKS